MLLRLFILLYFSLFILFSAKNFVYGQPSENAGLNQDMLNLLSKEEGSGRNEIDANLNVSEYVVYPNMISNISIIPTNEHREVEDFISPIKIPTASSEIEEPVSGTGSIISNSSTAEAVSTIMPSSTANDFNHAMSNMTSFELSRPSSSEPASTDKKDIFFSSNLVKIPNNVTFVTGETSVAANKQLVFYTGNVYAARSFDGGKDWQYLNVNTDMKTCCDQDTIYDPAHDIFVWYRQGLKDTGHLENKVRIGVSKNLVDWTMYDIHAKNLDASWTNNALDYPYLSLGTKYLYISTDMVNNEGSSTGSIIRNTALVMRLSLDDLSNFLPVSYSYYASRNKFTFTLANGAKDTMFWGTHLSNDKMRIYEWSESQNWEGIKKYDIGIPAWSQLSIGGAKCGIQKFELGEGREYRDGNWCNQADSRISSAWYIDGKLGFFWNADAGTTSALEAIFTQPYINAAVFDTNKSMTYLGRPYIWNYYYPVLYASAYPDKDGNLGVITYYGNGQSVPPTLAFGVREKDRLNISEPWKMVMIKGGTNSPKVNIERDDTGKTKFVYEWGDYIRLRSTPNSLGAWYGAGFVLEGGSTKQFIKPYFFNLRYENR